MQNTQIKKCPHCWQHVETKGSKFVKCPNCGDKFGVDSSHGYTYKLTKTSELV